MLIIEESSYLQESAHTETERTITDDSFVLALQNGRNEDANKIDEAIVSTFNKCKRTNACIY